MSGDDSGAMVAAGEAGGKSTFIGALITFVCDIEGDRYQGDYRLDYGSKNEFDKNVYKRMQSNFAYPSQTMRLDSYVVEVMVNADGGFSAKRSLKMMDIPGEIQQDSIDNAIERIRNGNWDKNSVMEKYNQGFTNEDPIREKVDDGVQLNEKEEEILYLYQYLSANRIVLLLNLHKFINRPSLEPVLTAELIRRVSRERRCLLLVTAADVIDYNPDEFRSGMFGRSLAFLSPSPRIFDTRLYEYITDGNNLPPGRRTSDIKKLVRSAKDNDVSMFSVAVPEGSQGDIKVEGGSIKTQGFSNVVDWLLQT